MKALVTTGKDAGKHGDPCSNLPQSCLVADRAHADMLRLCHDLEQIADSLPNMIDRRLCLIVAAQIVPLVQTSHAYEEAHVFPAFVAKTATLPLCNSTPVHLASIRRLKAEHIEDECAAQDLAEMLRPIGYGIAVENPEALGFMLRAFFEAMRRHIAFEREHILPVLAHGGPS